MKASTRLLVTLLVVILAAGCRKKDDPRKPPEIFSLTPNVGLEGDVVIISGKRFAKKLRRNKATFGGLEADVLLARKDSLTVLVPVGATTGPVKAIRGRKASNELNFTVLQIPTITRIIPAFGPEGAYVTIQGRYFGQDVVDNEIYFDGLWTPTVTASTTELTCFVPIGAVTGPVRVHVGPDMSNEKLFTVTTPRLFVVEEYYGPVDGAVVLSGENFSPVPDENIVRFAGIESSVLFASSFGNSLSTVVPDGTRSGMVTVEVTGRRGVSNGLPFCLEGTPPAPPTIASFGPTSGAVGDPVQILGSNFSPNPSDNEIRFGGILAPTLAATTGTLDTEVPSEARTGPVTVRVAGRTATSGDFTVSGPAGPPPAVTGLVFPQGTEGDPVLIRGLNFSPEPSNNHAYFDGIEAEMIGSAPEGLYVRVPFSSTGSVTVDVGVTVGVSGVTFQWVPPPPPATSNVIVAYGNSIPTPSDNVIFVVDISGTMGWVYGTFVDRFGATQFGASRLDLVKDRVAQAIDALPPTHIFNIVAYDCTPIAWMPVGQFATSANKQDAITNFLDTLIPGGSSDTGTGVSFAIATDPLCRTIILASDGSPTCGPTSEAAHLCQILSNNPQKAAVHTVPIQGFGSFLIFMQDLANLSGGIYIPVN